jgi:hypothetical protein
MSPTASALLTHASCLAQVRCPLTAVLGLALLVNKEWDTQAHPPTPLQSDARLAGCWEKRSSAHLVVKYETIATAAAAV